MISKMKKILLAGKIEDREKVLTILRSTELVHVDAAVPEKIKIPEALNSEYEYCAQALSILAQLKVEDDNNGQEMEEINNQEQNRIQKKGNLRANSYNIKSRYNKKKSEKYSNIYSIIKMLI